MVIIEGLTNKWVFRPCLKASTVCSDLIPQTGSGRAESPISYGTELGPGGFKKVASSRAEVTCGCFWGKEFLQVGWSIAMDTLVSEERELVFNPE